MDFDSKIGRIHAKSVPGGDQHRGDGPEPAHRGDLRLGQPADAHPDREAHPPAARGRDDAVHGGCIWDQYTFSLNGRVQKILDTCNECLQKSTD